MKSTIIAISALAAIASARSVNKARQTTNFPFELDVTTKNGGQVDYYSREDGYIWVNISPEDNIESAAVRSIGNHVACTISDVRGYTIRTFTDTYVRQSWENDHTASIGCFFPGESKATYADKIVTPPQPARREVGQAFEMDLTYQSAGTKDFYSREDGFIQTDVLAGDKLVRADVRSIKGDVVCTIKDINGYQVRKFGGEHPQTIELSEYEGSMARTVRCVFPGEQ